MARKDRQLQDTGPALRFLQQAIEPLQLERPHQGRRSPYRTTPHIEAAPHTEPESMASGPHLFDPQLLQRHPKAHQHQLWLLVPQGCFHHGPLV